MLYDDGEKEAVMLASEKLKWLLPPEVSFPLAIFLGFGWTTGCRAERSTSACIIRMAVAGSNHQGVSSRTADR